MRNHHGRILRRLGWAGAFLLASAAVACSSLEQTREVALGVVNPHRLGPMEKPSLRVPEQPYDNSPWFERVEDYTDYPKTVDAPTGPANMLDPNDPLLENALIRGTQWPMVANAGSSHVYDSEQGYASFYSDHKIATGEQYNSRALTAAHKSLPFGTIVRCTRLDSNESVIVVINDRGPYVRGRILDLSIKAARQLDMVDDGVVPCRLEILAYPLVETMGPRGNG